MSNICVIDIGSFSAKAVLAQKQQGILQLLASSERRSKGIRKSGIYDMEGFSNTIEEVMSDLEKTSGKSLSAALILISGPMLASQRTRGTVIVSRREGEVTNLDIERVRQTAESVVLTPNRVKLHNLVHDYMLDGSRGLANPLGMRGTKLEVESILIDTLAFHIKNFERCLAEAGVQPVEYVASALMGATGVLSERDINVGAAAVDWGASTITLSVYEDGKLIHFATFNQGADLITSDLGIGLRIPIDIAEAVKIQYGSAFSESISKKENVELSQFDQAYTEVIPRKTIADIVQARVEDQLHLINSELKKIGKDGRLPGGVVFYGGGAKLAGITDIARRSLYLTSRMGSVSRMNFTSELSQDQSFANVIGGAIYAAAGKVDSYSPLLGSIKRFFKLLIP